MVIQEAGEERRCDGKGKKRNAHKISVGNMKNIIHSKSFS
jgi:hypothetical protein